MPLTSTSPGSGSSGATTWSLADTYANLPAPGPDGQVFFPEDGCVFLVSNGTVWQPRGPYFPLTPPVVADYSAVNGGSSSFGSSGGIAYLTDAAHGDSDSLCIYEKAIPSSNKVTVGFVPYFGPSTLQYNGQTGIVFRDPVSARMVAFRIMNISSDLYLSVTALQNPVLPVIEYAGLMKCNYLAGMSLLFMRWEVSGGNRIFSLSLDGKNFNQIFSGSNANYVTPTKAGIFVNARNGITSMSLYSWKEGS